MYANEYVLKKLENISTDSTRTNISSFIFINYNTFQIQLGEAFYLLLRNPL
jgi:hypothetical protein